METILRTAAIYLVLLLLFRLTGKRSLAEMTTFDFVLLLIISEATQQALVGEDYSVTTAMLVIVTFLSLDIVLSLVKQYSVRLERVLDSVPLVILENGRLLTDRTTPERIDVEDILARARELHGLERLEQIKYAILERNGGISIIPQPREEPP